MKRSEPGLLPVMSPVRRRYQRNKRNCLPPVVSPVRRREKKESRNELKSRGSCSVTALGDGSQIERESLCRAFVLPSPWSPCPALALPFLLPREYVGKGCEVWDVEGVQRGLQAPVVGPPTILHASQLRVAGDRDAAEGCARGFRRAPGAGQVRGDALAGEPIVESWCHASKERR